MKEAEKKRERREFLAKINVGEILQRHFATLVNSNTGKPDLQDWVIFLILPLIFACTFSFFKPSLDKDIIDTLINTLSIFVGLLINVVVLIFDMIKRERIKAIKNQVLQETLYNILFTIILSLVTIILSLATFIEFAYFKMVTSFIVYLFLGNFLITLLMIVKRMYKLFLSEIEEI